MEQSLTTNDDGYDRISKALGKAMANAYAEFMEDVKNGGGSFAGSNFAEDDIKQFFTQLGGAELEVIFSKNAPSGKKKDFHNNSVALSNFSGSLTIGTRVEW